MAVDFTLSFLWVALDVVLGSNAYQIMVTTMYGHGSRWTRTMINGAAVDNTIRPLPPIMFSLLLVYLQWPNRPLCQRPQNLIPAINFAGVFVCVKFCCLMILLA